MCLYHGGILIGQSPLVWVNIQQQQLWQLEQLQGKSHVYINILVVHYHRHSNKYLLLYFMAHIL